MGPKEPSVPTNEEAQDRAARERREAAPEQAAPGEGLALAALGASASPRPPSIGSRPPLGLGQVQVLQRFGGNRALGALLARRGSEHAAPPLQGESAHTALRTSDGPGPLQHAPQAAAPVAIGANVRGALQRQARRGLRVSRAGGRSAIQRVTTYAVGPRKRALDEGLARVAAAHAAPVAFMAELAKLGGGAFTYLNQRYDNPTDPPVEQQRPQEDDPQAAAKNNLNQMVLSKASLKAYFVALGRLVGLIAPDADGGDSISGLFTLLSRCSNVQKSVTTFLLGEDAAGLALDNLPSLQGPGGRAVAEKFKNGPVREKIGALGKVTRGILKPSNKNAFPIPAKDALILFSSGTDHVFTIVKLGAVYTLYQGNVNLFTIAEGQGNKAIANFQAFLNDIADADTAKQIPWFGQDLGSPLFTYQLVKLKSGVFAYLFG